MHMYKHKHPQHITCRYIQYSNALIHTAINVLLDGWRGIGGGVRLLPPPVLAAGNASLCGTKCCYATTNIQIHLDGGILLLFFGFFLFLFSIIFTIVDGVVAIAICHSFIHLFNRSFILFVVDLFFH